MMASYHLYNRMRPSASKQSVKRSKELLDECGGAVRLQGLIHPGFKDVSTVLPSGDQNFVQELRGFRPRAEKKGNVLKTATLRTMEQSKLDRDIFNAAQPTHLQDDGTSPASLANNGMGTSSSSGGSMSRKRKQNLKRQRPDEVPTKPAFDTGKARMSKRARKKLGQGHGGAGDDAEFAGWQVSVDGVAVGDKDAPSNKPASNGKSSRPQFFLSTERDMTEEAKERGLDMEKYQVDLIPDGDTDMKTTKSVMRWDARKKKYLPVMIAADGRQVKQKAVRRDETGQKVYGDAEKTDMYAKWAKTTKKRIQKVGELEQDAPLPIGQRAAMRNAQQMKTVDFNDECEAVATEEGKKKKPVVPFHGEVDEKFLTHKQKRMLKQRQASGVGNAKAKKELLTVQQMMLARKKRDENKAKQSPHLRKQAARAFKEKNKKRIEDRQQLMVNQSKSKMIIIPKGYIPKEKKLSASKFNKRKNFLTGAL